MNLDYALVTSASLPDQVKGSANYVELDKSQWLDLVDYSEELAGTDPDQQILLLICARGTAEQEEADTLRQQELESMENTTREKLEEAERLKREREENDRQLRSDREKLRQKSKSIFHALYGK